jgi:hypothetical protein
MGFQLLSGGGRLLSQPQPFIQNDGLQENGETLM